MKANLLISASLIALTAACGSEQTLGPDMDIGSTTSAGFTSLANGVDIEMEPGSQGGLHIEMNVQMSKDLADSYDDLYLRREVRRVDTGQLVSKSVTAPPMTEPEAGLVTSATLRVILCPAPVGIKVDDQELELTVIATDTVDGEGPQATLRFSPRCPGGEAESFCRRSCDG